MSATNPPIAGPRSASLNPAPVAWTVLGALSVCHMINDIMQSLLSSIYPLLQAEFNLDYTQIGLLTFAFQVTASFLQPLIGIYTDRFPMPKSLSVGMMMTFVGVLILSQVHSYPLLVIGAMLIGTGSAVFHPESSRIARAASGGRFGTAQSLFQVGGNFGQAMGPLLAAFLVVPFGRPVIGWVALFALAGAATLWQVGKWADGRRRAAGPQVAPPKPLLSRNRIIASIAILAVLTMTKNFYTASISSYYTFFLIHKFGLSAQASQVMLFLFLGGMAAGVMLGGIIGDRVGALTVIWVSILGVLPLTLLLPHVGLVATGILTVLIGLILASAFPAIVVYAQELVPGRTGLIAGLFFGFAFGMGGVAAALLGVVADHTSIEYVYTLCSFLPALGLVTIFLPRRDEIARAES